MRCNTFVIVMYVTYIIIVLCVLLFRVYTVCPLSVLLPVLANKDVHIYLYASVWQIQAQNEKATKCGDVDDRRPSTKHFLTPALVTLPSVDISTVLRTE